MAALGLEANMLGYHTHFLAAGRNGQSRRLPISR